MSLPTRKEALAKIEEGLIKIKQMFSDVTIKQKFEDVTLQDGSIIQVDVVAIGGKVTQNELPIPDGSYTLQDGSTIEVVGGLITEVSAAADQEPTEVEPMDMATPDKMKVACQNFATATPEQQQAMIVALMDYCFGWQIKKDAEDAKVKAAIDAYKATQGATIATLAAVQETMSQTFSMVKEIGEEPIKEQVKVDEPLTAYQKFQASKKVF
jgi:hypothetical protein